MNELLSLLNVALVELLIFSAFWFLLGAIDDLLIDLFWTTRKIYRKIRYYRTRPPMTAAELPDAQRPGLLAVFVPTWQEAGVIADMLGNCLKAWGQSGCDYRIYVGCYPNDMAGACRIMQAARRDSHLNLVMCNHDGPTSKADCLNQLWEALVGDEIAFGIKAKAVILHDAEDFVHRDELRLFDRLIEEHPAVQLPVLPLPVAGSPFVSSHYCDEFAEAHGKSLPVREALGASVPLAGVACAIDRQILGRVALDNNHRPFDSSSLTEDYELGFKISRYGQTILARLRGSDGELVCSRSHFPATLETAVRQKARWITGIALAGWDKLGWSGSLAQKWMLLRDRKAVFAAIVLFCAYICILLTGLLSLAWLAGWFVPARLPEGLVTLLWINFGFLIWRMGIRLAFVARLYGFRQGLLSIPRTFVANIIAIMAARRAFIGYLRHLFGAELGWDKTEHGHFPENLGKGKNA
ncbi:MAG: glycosyl transferase family protein [Sphingorhabdus sp.]